MALESLRSEFSSNQKSAVDRVAALEDEVCTWGTYLVESLYLKLIVVFSCQVRRKDVALVEAISEARSDGDARAIEERRAANEVSNTRIVVIIF